MKTLILAATISLGCARNDGNETIEENEIQSYPTSLSTAHGITVSYSTNPSPIPESTEFSVTFEVSDGSITGADATMPDHGGHGMNVQPEVNDNGDMTFTASPFQFHMPGYWLIHATVATATGQEERLDFEVDCCQ